MIRKPICAGTWYPQKTDEIEPFTESASKEQAIACVVPHAGWIYSGKVAGSVYSRLSQYDTYIIIGPNHTGYGSAESIFPKGEWQMPLGKVEVDYKLVAELIKNSGHLQKDFRAHEQEHSIEVQIPFIQYFNQNRGFKIVPIMLMSSSLEVAKDVANSIIKSIKGLKEKVLIIASSDMTHYEPDESARKKDKLAIDKMLNLDAEGLLNTVKKNNISMCGVLPATAVIMASVELGAKSASLVKYTTSAETSGDYNAVVGYAGIIIR